MDKAYQMVLTFHELYGHPARNSPKPLTQERVKKRGTWIAEELIEFAQAHNLVEQIDALVDIMYFVIGSFVEMGVKPEKMFEAVHEANMNKVWPDGELHMEGSKTLKPPGWIGPEQKIIQELEAQFDE